MARTRLSPTATPGKPYAEFQPKSPEVPAPSDPNVFKNRTTNKWINTSTNAWIGITVVAPTPPDVVVVPRAVGGAGVFDFAQIMKLKIKKEDEEILLILIAFMTAEHGELI